MAHGSGISVPQELATVFSEARKDQTVRYMKVGIVDCKSLVCLFTGKSVRPEDADTSCPLSMAVTDDTPCYIIYRLRDKTPPAEWLLVMFIPDHAKVREKMLYASTRDSLKRELGYSYFASDMHVTERSDLSFQAFDKRTLVNEAERLSVMSQVERLRMQEDTAERSPMTKGSYIHAVKFPLSDAARASFQSLVAREVNFTQLAIDPAKETIELTQSCTVSGGLEGIRAEVCREQAEPRFCFFRLQAAGGERVVFVYACPESAKVRVKMTYSTAKAAALQAAGELGLVVDRSVEVRDSGDLDEADLLRAPAPPGAAVPVGADAAARPAAPSIRRSLTRVPVLPTAPTDGR